MSASNDVAILVPVLRRPHRVAALMADIEAAMSRPYRLLFIVDASDALELRALAKAGADHLVVPRNRRTYACKINDGVRATTEPWVFLAADDVHFHRGWFEEAERVGVEQTVGVVGTNDLLNPRVMAGTHSTHSLVLRSYARAGTIDEPDRLLHEGYPHEYVDDELVGTAKLRGSFACAPDSIVEHLHPYNHKAPVDRTYQRGWAGRRVGKRVYDQRRPLWEPSTSQ